MRSDCIRAITEAAGRPLTAGELNGIEGRITQAMRENARDNRQETQAQSPRERVQAAAERVAKELAEEKVKRAVNVAKQIVKTAENERAIEAMKAQGIGGMEALRRLDTVYQDAKAGVASLEQRRNGIYSYYARGMEGVVKATQRFAGFWTNRSMVRDVLRELYGEDSGNGTAKSVAKEWSGIAEGLRKQGNDAGKQVGKLKGWAAPQEHSQAKVARAGVEQWLADITPKLNREAYVNAEGTPMSDMDLDTFLRAAYRTISTDGASNIEPGRITGGSIKNRGQDARVLHFDNADAYMDYQAKYGERSLLETMFAHIGRQSRDIATLETYGPNAEHAYRYLLDKAYKEQVEAAPTKIDALKAERERTQTFHDVATGKAGPMADPGVAKAFSNARAALILGRLGSATLSAITDGANTSMIARTRGIPKFTRWVAASKALWSGSFRQEMRAQGYGLELLNHSVSRFGEETFGHGMLSNVANTLLRVSGLNWLDNARRAGGAAMLMGKLGDMVSRFDRLDSMDGNDTAIFRERGVTDQHYQVWRKAALSDGALTAGAIARIPDADLADIGKHPDNLRRDAMQALMGVVHSDIDTIVPMMTDRTRANVTHTLGNVKRGTIGGEIYQSALQFKSFPLAMISNHWQRLMSRPTIAGKIAYGAELVATATLLGAFTVQMKSLATGQNPQDMTDPKFAARAFVAGGATGLYGDLLVKPIGDSGFRTTLAEQLGPLFDTGEALYRIAQAAHSDATGEKKAQLPGELIRFAKSNTPFANLWYTKAVTDRLIFQALSDYFSPGYAQRMEQRAQKEYGTNYYWPPASGTDRLQAPDLSTALGSH